MKRGALIIFVLATFVFLPSLRNQFTGWDDTAYTVDNPNMKSAGMAGLGRIWGSKENEQYYPLSFTLLWVEYQAFGDSPLGYHVVSVLLHAINAALLLIVLMRMGMRFGPAMFTAALFAVHPVQVMSVAWIAEQKNLLSCLFVLLCMLMWMQSGECVETMRTAKAEGAQRREERKDSEGVLRSSRSLRSLRPLRSVRSHRALWYTLALICYAAAVMSKSAVVGLPIALAVMDRFMVGRTIAATLRRAAPMLAVAAASVVLTMVFEQKFVQHRDAAGIPDLPARLLLAAAAPWWYLKQLGLPLDLSPFYPLWIVSVANWRWWLSVLAWACVGVGCVRALTLPAPTVAHSHPHPGPLHRPSGSARETAASQGRGGLMTWRGWLLWSLAHYVVILSPTLGIIPFGNMHATHVSDHFLYVACIGPFALAGLSAQRVMEFIARHDTSFRTLTPALSLGRSPQVARSLSAEGEGGWLRFCHAAIGVAAIGVVCILAVMTVRYIPVFRDAESLWSHSLKRAPDNGVAYLGLGVALRNDNRADEALPLFLKAAQLQPELEDAPVFAAQIQMENSDLAAAEQTVRMALAMNGQSPTLTELLARVLERRGRVPEALSTLENAVALDPTNPETRLRLAQMYLAAGRFNEAEALCAEAIRLKPDLGFAYIGLATCLKNLSKWGRAVDVLKDGLQHVPGDAALRNMLALFYAAAPDAAVRSGAEAVEIAEQLSRELADADAAILQPPLDTLAAAYAEVSRFEDAARAAEDAADLARKIGNAAAAQESTRRAALYRQRQPFRMR